MSENNAEQSEVVKGNKLFRFIKSMAWYVMLLVIIFLVVVSVQSNQYKSLFGYSIFNIKTASMHSELPKGSLVFTKSLDAYDYLVGDDITFFDAGLTRHMVTHRIIDIDESENFLRFETKGVDNFEADEYLVPEGNVVGKVFFHIPTLGLYISYIQENLLIVGGLLVLVILTVLAINNFIKVSRQTKAKRQEGEVL